MIFDVNEIKYNNKIKGDFSDFKLDDCEKGLKLKFKNDIMEGSFSISFDEVRKIWAKFLETNQSEAKQTSEKFIENLRLAEDLSRKISSDSYKETKEKLDDMKNFVAIYSDLIEHAKFGIASQKNLDQERQNLNHEKNKTPEKVNELNEFTKKAKEQSENFQKNFPTEKLSGDAISLSELLEKMEIEKKHIREEEVKRLKELKKDVEQKKELEFTPPRKKSEVVDVHIDSDASTVDPLFDENNMDKYRKKQINLDKIDFSKL